MGNKYRQTGPVRVRSCVCIAALVPVTGVLLTELQHIGNFGSQLTNPEDIFLADQGLFT